MAATKQSHLAKHHRNPSKLSQNSRSSSSTKLHPGHGHNLAFTAIKIAADHGPPKRVDSSQTIRSDNRTAAAVVREYEHSVGAFPPGFTMRWSVSVLTQSLQLLTLAP